MKRTFASIIAVAMFAGLFALSLAFSRGAADQRAGLVPTVQAQEAERATTNDKIVPFPRSRECTLGGLSGKYGGMVQGTALPPLTPVPAPGVSVGSFEVDAAGNLTGADTLSLGGQIIPRTYTGTVSVKSNCTFTSRITINTGLPGLTINLSGVIVDGGNEIQFVQTDAGTIFSGVAKRL